MKREERRMYAASASSTYWVSEYDTTQIKKKMANLLTIIKAQRMRGINATSKRRGIKCNLKFRRT